MPNALSPSLTGPPWFPSMTFPSTWYHPVYAARVIETAADLATLDWTWSPDPGIADMRRTETEAQLAIDQANEGARNAIMGIAPPANFGAINQNSASWQASLNAAANAASAAAGATGAEGAPQATAAPKGGTAYPLTMPPPGTLPPQEAHGESGQSANKSQPEHQASGQHRGSSERNRSEKSSSHEPSSRSEK